MTSRERVLRAVEFKKPDRVPIFLFNKDQERSDISFIGPGAAKDFVPPSEGMTEWGFAWERVDDTMGQPKNIVIEDIAKAKDFIAPDGNDQNRFLHIPNELKRLKDKFVMAGWGISGFNLITFLLGFENTLEYLYTDRENLKIICEKVFEYENDLIRNFLKFDIDGINFYDDWGMQFSLMIDPQMWRDFFKPFYKKQFEIIKKAGKKIYFHSCGNVYDIIGDLIEIGVDMFNFNQPDVMGVDMLAGSYGGKTTFICPVDLQKIAIKADKKTIYDYTQKLINKFGRPNGGFIGYVEEYHSIGLSEENYKYCWQALIDLGDIYK